MRALWYTACSVRARRQRFVRRISGVWNCRGDLGVTGRIGWEGGWRAVGWAVTDMGSEVG